MITERIAQRRTEKEEDRAAMDAVKTILLITVWVACVALMLAVAAVGSSAKTTAEIPQTITRAFVGA